jgi:hypothetical protein
MKKVFTTVGQFMSISFLFMSIAITSFSQTRQFRVTINSTTTNFNYGDRNGELKPFKKDFKGIQAGASYEAGISPLFSIVPELYFTMKGGILKKDNPLTINKSTLRVFTIDMPLMARLRLDNFYVNAGPYVSYTVSGRWKIDGAEGQPAKTSSISFGSGNSAFNRWDAGAQVGAGYDFHTRKSILTLDVRYGYGLTSISRQIDRYNRMFGISLSVSRLSKPGNKTRG